MISTSHPPSILNSFTTNAILSFHPQIKSKAKVKAKDHLLPYLSHPKDPTNTNVPSRRHIHQTKRDPNPKYPHQVKTPDQKCKRSDENESESEIFATCNKVKLWGLLLGRMDRGAVCRYVVRGPRCLLYLVLLLEDFMVVGLVFCWVGRMGWKMRMRWDGRVRGEEVRGDFHWEGKRVTRYALRHECEVRTSCGLRIRV